MGKPMILYGLLALSNASFEDDADGTDPPTGWNDTASVNGVNETDDAQYHSAGEGLPSAQSVRQNVSSSTPGNKAVLRQRLAVSGLPGFVQAEQEVEVAFVAMGRAASPTAAANASVGLAQYSGGTSTPGTGTPQTAPRQRSFKAGAEGTWLLHVVAATLHASTVWLDVSLEYALGTYGATDHFWWDRAMVGCLCDLERGLRRLDPMQETGVEINEGDGVVEAVRTRKPSTRLDLEVRNVLEGGKDWDAWLHFLRWANGDAPGRLALWGDRDYHTNARRHYQLATVDKRVRVRYPVGVARRDYRFRLICPSEGAA